MPARGKRYRAARDNISADQAYEPANAIRLVRENATANFDETVELHARTGLDPRHADQQLRGTVLLPHGLGRSQRVIVFAQGDGARQAEEAGGDHVGLDDLAKKIQDGWLEFDIAIATKDVMGKIGKLGRVLGPRGLMPNPKTGTVVDANDLAKAVKEARQGRVEFRLDRTASIHTPIGKASFTEDALLDNLATIVDAISRERPSGAKGQLLRTITVTSTMGPGVKLDVQTTMGLGQTRL